MAKRSTCLNPIRRSDRQQAFHMEWREATSLWQDKGSPSQWWCICLSRLQWEIWNIYWRKRLPIGGRYYSKWTTNCLLEQEFKSTTKNYTTMEKELLAIVLCLKEYSKSCLAVNYMSTRTTRISPLRLFWSNKSFDGDSLLTRLIYIFTASKEQRMS